jgi:peptidoglycan/LPS O-acetylase OafA/YrhL
MSVAQQIKPESHSPLGRGLFNVVHGKYFPHIDGIRTIAVLSVVFYHIFGSWCSGGYVGVDIFFVISGYLIIGGLLMSLEKGEYSIAKFYNNRIRRIIPAYLVVIVFVLIVGICIYGKEYVRRLGAVTSFSTVFSANIYFYFRTGYFDSAAITNPLLHLWSLGVEEQFYILTPLYIALIYRIRKEWMLQILLITGLVSLGFALACNFLHHDTFNFYMLPPRAWELMAGGVLAYLHRAYPVKGENGNWGMIGALLCIIPCFAYNDRTLFPGVTAIPPILGSLLMIRYGSAGLCGTVLASRPFVFIGKISYSLYLWHWPLIVYWNYITDDSKSPLGLFSVFLFSLLMSWLSWRFVEMPVRLSKTWNFRRAVLLVLIGGGLIGVFSVLLWKTNKVNWLLPSGKETVIEPFWEGQPPAPNIYPDPCFPKCESPTPNSLVTLGHDDAAPAYVLWGDSHARSLAPGFDGFSRQTGINGLYINRKHILSYKGSERASNPNNARDLDLVLAWLKSHPEIKNIVLVNRWAMRMDRYVIERPAVKLDYVLQGQDISSSPEKFLEIGLMNLCQQLKQAGFNVVIISSVPEQGLDVPSSYLKSKRFGYAVPCGVDYEVFSQRQKRVMAILQNLQKQELAEIVWIDDFFFPDKTQCQIMDRESNVFYMDSNHLTPTAAKKLLFHYTERLKKALK